MMRDFMTHLQLRKGVHVALVPILLALGSAFAQERSVKPGINDRFEKPDMEEVVSLMEQEHSVIYKYRHAIVAALGLEPGSAVADVGAGTGFIAQLLARDVGPEGKVFAVEISQESLDYIMKEAEKEGHANIAPVLGEHRTTNLSRDSADVIVTIRTYHHFEYPVDMLESIKAALRPEGRFVVIDRERIKGVTMTSEEDFEHWRAGKGTITDEILDAGFVLEKELPLIPDFYYLVFKER